MRRYWDTSGLVEALHDESVRLKVTKETAVTRSHSFSEVFSALTGGRLGVRYAPDDAAEMIASLAKDLEVVELSLEESLAAFAQAGKLACEAVVCTTSCMLWLRARLVWKNSSP